MNFGSFSEAQAVFDPGIPKNVFPDLASESFGAWTDPRLAPSAAQLKPINRLVLPSLDELALLAG